MPHVVFLSLFLGLASGIQPIDLRVDSAVKSVRVTLGGHEVATLHEAPWHTTVDFGGDLQPRQLLAVGYDARGNEIARASQIINLPRPRAEVEIALKHNNGLPASVELIGRHLQFARPKRATMTLDGKRLRVTNFTARLPDLDWAHTHIISAEMRFADGTVARRELVLSGGFSDAAGTELTPILVTQRSGQKIDKLDGCFSVDGVALRTAAVETTNALVSFVQEPDPREAAIVLNVMRQIVLDTADRRALRRETELDAETTERLNWPVSKSFSEKGLAPAVLFESSVDVDAPGHGMLWLLMQRLIPSPPAETPRQFADAVAVAGLQTIKRGRRRAVVLLLSSTPDKSIHTPAEVRRYLAAIGVPLFVWSLSGPRPDLIDTWGEVDDISIRSALRAAVDRLRRTLAAQNIAWVAVDPLTALRVDVKDSCGVTTVARLPRG